MDISKSVLPKTGQPDTRSVFEKSGDKKIQASTAPTLSPRTASLQKKNFLGLGDALAGLEATLGERALGQPEVASLCQVSRHLSDLMQHLWSVPVDSAAFKQTCTTAREMFIELVYRADYLAVNHEQQGMSKASAQELNGVMMQVREKFLMVFAMQLEVWTEKDSRSIASLCTQPEPVQLSHTRPRLTTTARRTNFDESGTISPRRKPGATLEASDTSQRGSPRSPRVVSERKSSENTSAIPLNLTTASLPPPAEKLGPGED